MSKCESCSIAQSLKHSTCAHRENRKKKIHLRAVAKEQEGSRKIELLNIF